MTGFYARLRTERQDDDDLQRCVENVVRQLEGLPSSIDRPGMLLGKIQSGKTRGFLGVIAKAFDDGFDIAIVLTKGTVTLASQTVKRIGRDYKTFVDGDEVIVFDVMEMPEKLTRSELRRKMVIVAKKQAKNLERVLNLLDKKHPELKDKKILLVDDEADLASVRFKKKKEAMMYNKAESLSRWTICVRWFGRFRSSKLPRRHTRCTCNRQTTRRTPVATSFFARSARPSPNCSRSIATMSGG
jgi:hypothetical protein